ncbi:MAG: CRISPR-associated protein Csm7 [Methylococcaceae bacterium]|nr:CRISPR-associated protein Csm7 [Methylococcaceae bacterium]
MQSFCVTLKPLSAFATPLKGDTLFGQLCWAIRNRLSDSKLINCLEGYNHNRPFAVVSDAFPESFLPLPKLPSCFYQHPEGEDRKAVKKLAWLPEVELQKPLNEWLRHAVNSSTIASSISNKSFEATHSGTTPSSRVQATSLSEKHPHSHNTINRQTNTTGEGGFAPYSVEQEWFIPGLRWTVYVLLDTGLLNMADFQQCLKDIGNFGFGKDASIGLGKFEVVDFQEKPLPAQANANACLTLAPCAPQGQGFDSNHSYYQLFTRFGRHGDVAVHQEGKPFKNPVLLAQTAAVIYMTPEKNSFIGQGIGGNGELSKTLAATVHQGYAPVIAINFNPKVPA